MVNKLTDWRSLGYQEATAAHGRLQLPGSSHNHSVSRSISWTMNSTPVPCMSQLHGWPR